MEDTETFAPPFLYSTPFSDPTHRQDLDAATSWHMQHPPHQPMHAAHNGQGRLYPTMGTPLSHVDYAASPSAADFFNQYPHPSPVMGQNLALNLSGPQIHSSIGPSRVVTRRQSRAAQMHATPHPHLPAGGAISQGENHDRQHQLYMQHLSRSKTPDNALSARSFPPIGPSPLSMQPHTSHSPQYDAPSSSSAQHPYGLSPAHARSMSNTAPANPIARSASPALSVVSAITSNSSASQTFHNYDSGTLTPMFSKSKQRKQRLFNVDRRDICLYHQQHPHLRQEDIAAEYGVERSTISKILKQKQKWLNVPDGEEIRIAKHRPSKFPEIEEEMIRWLEECSERSMMLTDSVIRAKAKEVAKGMQIPDDKFKASSGWVENFKQRHGIRRGVYQGEEEANKKKSRALGGAGDTFVLHDDVLQPRPTLADFIVQNDLYDIDASLNGTGKILNRKWFEIETEDEDDEDYVRDFMARQNYGVEGPLPLPRKKADLHRAANSPQSASSATSSDSSSSQSQPLTPPPTANAPQPAIETGSEPVDTVSFNGPAAMDEDKAPYGIPTSTEPLYPVTGPGIPSVQEAVAAVDLLVSFALAQASDFLRSEEHGALSEIRLATWCLSKGFRHQRRGGHDDDDDDDLTDLA
ncbi:CenpB-DNA-bind-domain-containing protein [Auriscalpium vulgare]|uniref:CenpB-DNA-bind-domain-containing protein n=1 Tax=Auriscalpium vulgare TaxID=40419 RepID=A0ACB8RDJ0_9AGAM|nr:CenpB-DNA-bind-domain-containing protein [Auriscalpium vulgare]